MDYIVTTAQGGVTKFRQKYAQRTHAIERFERLAGCKVEHILETTDTRHTVERLEARSGGVTVTFRTRP